MPCAKGTVANGNGNSNNGMSRCVFVCVSSHTNSLDFSCELAPPTTGGNHHFRELRFIVYHHVSILQVLRSMSLLPNHDDDGEEGWRAIVTFEVFCSPSSFFAPPLSVHFICAAKTRTLLGRWILSLSYHHQHHHHRPIQFLETVEERHRCGFRIFAQKRSIAPS